jgi:hypothetical protein
MTKKAQIYFHPGTLAGLTSSLKNKHRGIVQGDGSEPNDPMVYGSTDDGGATTYHLVTANTRKIISGVTTFLSETFQNLTAKGEVIVNLGLRKEGGSRTLDIGDEAFVGFTSITLRSMLNELKVEANTDNSITAIVDAGTTNQAFQDLIDRGVTVFQADTQYGVPSFDGYTLNFGNHNYFFLSDPRSGVSPNFEFSNCTFNAETNITGPHTITFTGVVKLSGTSNIFRDWTYVNFESISLPENTILDTDIPVYTESLWTNGYFISATVSGQHLYFQYIDGEGGIKTSVGADVTPFYRLAWKRPINWSVDTNGVGPTERAFEVLDTITDDRHFTILGNGDVLMGKTVSISTLLAGIAEVVTKLTVDGTTDMGSPVEIGGTLNVKEIISGLQGYNMTVPLGGIFDGAFFGIHAGPEVSVDYPTDPIWSWDHVDVVTTKYYLVSGQISSKKYWFVTDVIDTGANMFSTCAYRQSEGSGASQPEEDAWKPEASGYTGIDPDELGRTAAMVYQSGAAGPSLNTDGEVHMHNLPVGLPSGKTKAGNLSITTDGISYIE